jgi:hypothetical protein
MKSEPEMDSASWETMEDRAQSRLDNRMGALGVIHQAFFSRKTSVRSYIAVTYNDIVSSDQLMDTGYYLKPMDSTIHRNTGITGSSTLNSKLRTRFTLRTGFRFSMLSYYLDMRTRNPFTGVYGVVSRGKGWTDFAEAYAETRIDLTNNLHVTAGLSFRYFLLNGHYGLEPRVALRWQVAAKHALSFGYGMHSQAEDVGLYLAETPVSMNQVILPNKNLNFSRAQHLVVGYDYLIRQDMRLKTELYYQYLYDIPVIPGNYFSLINSTGWYTNDSLVNRGTGYNTGVDLTFEKFLTKQFYILATVSLFDSKYRGGDGKQRNTRFNTGYVINLLGGKEWTFREKNLFGINLKASFTGGEYYVPVDLEESIASHREILDEANAYSTRLPAVFYLDLTVQYRINHRKFCGIWAIQVRNLLNRHPDMGYVYNDFSQTVEPVKSLGIIPLFSYKVEF